jgi:putative hydrolase of the HAD superfamily
VPPAYVLLDLYDTVVDGDWRGLRDALAERLGVDAPVLDQAFALTRPTRNIGGYHDEEGDMAAVLDAIGLEPELDVVRDLATFEHHQLRERIRLFPDSLEVVAALRERGVRTALVSNCSHSTRSVVERLRLEEAFDALILSFAVGARKPQPGIYEAALAALGVGSPSDAVFVDDQVRYCDGARALGIDTRLIQRPTASPFEGFAPSTNGHAVITALAELLDEG